MGDNFYSSQISCTIPTRTLDWIRRWNVTSTNQRQWTRIGGNCFSHIREVFYWCHFFRETDGNRSFQQTDGLEKFIAEKNNCTKQKLILKGRQTLWQINFTRSKLARVFTFLFHTDNNSWKTAWFLWKPYIIEVHCQECSLVAFSGLTIWIMCQELHPLWLTPTAKERFQRWKERIKLSELFHLDWVNDEQQCGNKLLLGDAESG